MKRIAISANTILLLVSLFSTLRMDAQAFTTRENSSPLQELMNDMPWEEMYLHIDREKYIAGEEIWFSIYTIITETGKLSDRSAIAYVELLNPWNTPVIRSRFLLSGGRGEGNFTLPDSISSGTYTIRAYTNRMKNFLPDYCFMHDIDILNTFTNPEFMRKGALINNLKLRKTNAYNEERGAVTLTADSLFERRSKVTLKLGTENIVSGQSADYDMSISVTLAEVAEELQGIEEYLLSKKRIPADLLTGIKTPLRYNFETYGHNLSVMINYREKDVSGSSDFLYMSIQGKVADFRYAGRDSAGRFTFVLPADNNLRNLIIQPEHATSNMVLEIEPSFSWIMPSAYSYKDSLTNSQIDIFSGLSFNYQASKIYGIRSKEEVANDEERNLKKRRFYGIPEMEIILDDYIQLPTMQEVFFELVPGVIIRTRKSALEMRITNPLTGMFYEEPPLVMIDGVIVNDLNVLVELNPETVEKVEVVKTPYLIGDLILHGIVNVITRTGNFSNITMPDYAVILPYRVIEKHATIVVPDYSDERNRLNRKPDLRNTLFWDPSVKTNSNGEAEIEFWTSDLPGIYIINIQGISGTGKKVSLHKLFTVR